MAKLTKADALKYLTDTPLMQWSEVKIRRDFTVEDLADLVIDGELDNLEQAGAENKAHELRLLVHDIVILHRRLERQQILANAMAERQLAIWGEILQAIRALQLPVATPVAAPQPGAGVAPPSRQPSFPAKRKS